MSRARQQGFSLLELSVVLAIISVLVGFGMTLSNTVMKNSDKLVTQERLLIIKKALDNYAAQNGFLPCPAKRALAADDSAFGMEMRNSTTCTTSADLVRVPASGTPFTFIGAVPVRALGLSANFAGDAWGNKFTYVVSGQHVGDIDSYATVDGPISVRYGDRTMTSYTITTARTDALGAYNVPGPAATFVVISHGPDGKGAYPTNGITISTPCGSSNNNDVENCDDANMIYYDTAYNDGTDAAKFFDDYVVWSSNALNRIPTAGGGGGDGGAGCSSGCEEWCAPCTNTASYPTKYICSRSIISSSPCRAYCIYAYPGNNVVCP